MSQDSVERFLGRLITDDAFRKCASDNLSRACLENGFSLTDEEKKILQKLEFEKFVSISKTLDKGIRWSRYDQPAV
ncbi:MAG: hypothetical protein GY749_10170 [Desulfobacteraceae bacterium]|nr:hypothetical protein [Desulfobacteraceae bacterium]